MLIIFILLFIYAAYVFQWVYVSALKYEWNVVSLYAIYYNGRYNVLGDSYI